MKKRAIFLLSASAVSIMAAPASAERALIPSVVVTVENAAPSRGAFQTPFWVAMHDGSFDIYDRGVALGDVAANPNLVPAPAVERLAEDGTTGPISEQFSILEPGSPQTTIFGPAGPLAPGDRSSVTLNIDPSTDRFFSYASMVIPSNDAFIANGMPTAHELFDENGEFVGKDFSVAGSAVLDAGTEVNDEVAGNTAFLAQAAPDTGVIENGVIALHEGFRGDLSFPDGVLSQPVFGMADFLSPNYRAANFSFRYIDVGRIVNYRSMLSTDQEVTGAPVVSDGRGRAFATSRGDFLFVRVLFSRLTGPVRMAHLHLGQPGTNGPVVVDLGEGISGRSVIARIRASDVVGVLADGDNPILNLINEAVAGNIYINLHTDANPGGEIRGQLAVR